MFMHRHRASRVRRSATRSIGLRLLADSLTKKEIADQLAFSLHTVDKYLRRIYGKLHVSTLGGAVANALRDGLL